MKYLFKICFAAFAVMLSNSSMAIAPSDYAENFIIDLDEPLPRIEELREQFRPAPVYDRKFDYYWNIGTEFDREFAQTIRRYGTRNKRLKWASEEKLLDLLQSVPPEMYEYIGPYLHTVPGIPEKILNMPGIKETKNKFPSRIASRFADIEDIEMLSPAFYFLLMPEIWPENQDPNEKPVPAPLPLPSNKYNPKLLDSITKVVRPEDFAPGAVVKSPLRSRLRTLDPEASSLLSSPDVKAVAKTIVNLIDFGNNIDVQLRIIEAGNLLDAWDEARGKGLGVAHLKEIVHPCSRLVQKVRLAGLERDFKRIIAKNAFDEKSWAYTCDKTIKAYRLLNISQIEAQTLMLFRKNVFMDQLGRYNYKYGPIIAAIMQSTVERYNAPLSDMLEVKRNYSEIENALRESKLRIGTDPIFIY